MLREDDRRHFMRLSAQTDADVKRLDTNETLRVQLIDISASGCAFFCPCHLNLGEQIDFIVMGQGQNTAPLCRRGQVVRVSSKPQSHLVAVTFLDSASA